MALTAIIEEELLAALETGTDPEAVMHRYQASKGPLYAALARATATAREQFDEVRMELESATQELETLQSQAQTMTDHIAQLQADKAKVTAQKAALQHQIDQQQASLNTLHQLRQQGFDPTTLHQFTRLVQEMAVTTQQTPQDTVRQFLAHVQDYAQLVQLPRQVAEAEQRAQAAIDEASRREQQAKVRTQAIRAAEWMVQHHLTSATVTVWQTIADHLHLSSEALAQDLATALQTYGTCQARESALTTKIVTLRQTQSHLERAVQALQDARSTITQSLQAVEQEGCTRIQAMADHAQQAFQGTVDHLAHLQADAAALGTAVAWAQAIRSDDPTVWQQVDATAWLGFWAKFQHWLALHPAMETVAPPERLGKRLEQHARSAALYGPIHVSLTELTEWLGIGLGQVATRSISDQGNPVGDQS